MPGLMNMPKEIRDQILKLCLLVDGTINPYPAFYEDKDHFANCNRKPDIALLKVNKVLNFEATDIFYEENTWQLSLPRPLEHLPFKKDSIWKFHSDRITRLRTIMTMYDLSPNTILMAARKADDWSILNGHQQAILIHSFGFRAAVDTWDWKKAMMIRIMPLTLEIDMKNMYCPIGCCRSNFIELLGSFLSDAMYESFELSTSGFEPFTNAPTTDVSLVGLTKGEGRYLISRWKGQDPEDESDGESIDAAIRFRTRWWTAIR